MDIINLQCNSLNLGAQTVDVKDSDQTTRLLPYMDSEKSQSENAGLNKSDPVERDENMVGVNDVYFSGSKQSDVVEDIRSNELESCDNPNFEASEYIHLEDEDDYLLPDNSEDFEKEEKSLTKSNLPIQTNDEQHINIRAIDSDVKNARKRVTPTQRRHMKIDNRFQPVLHSFQSVPFRILLPELWTRHLLGKGNKFIKFVAYDTSAYIQVVKKHKISNLEDQIVLISGSSTKNQMAGLAEMLTWLQKSINQTLVDSESQLALTILVPEKAVSALIGYKGSTINRIAKHCGCEIYIVLDSPPLTYKGFSDRAVIIRGKSFNFIASAVAHLHETLNDLFRRHKLTEADFLHFIQKEGRAPIPRRKKDNNQKLNTADNNTKALQSSSEAKKGVAIEKQSDFVVKRGGHEDKLDYQPSALVDSPEQFTYLLKNAFNHVFVQLILNKTHAYWIIGNSGCRKREIESRFSVVLKIYHTNVIDASERIVNFRGQLLNVCRAINFIFTTYDQSASVTTAISIPNKPVLNTSLNNLCEYVTKQMNINAWLVPSQIPSTNVSLLYLAGSSSVKVNALLLIIQQLTHLTISRTSAPLGTTKKRRFSEIPQKNIAPPEATFVEKASKLTFPKVITTSQLFTVNVSFKYQSEIISEVQEKETILQLSRMLKQRIGNIQLTHRIKRENNCQEINIQITGTPIGNSTSILLLHEFFMNLADEKATELPEFQKPLPIRHLLCSDVEEGENTSKKLFPMTFL